MAYVKSASNTFGDTATSIATFASPVTAGNLIWVCVLVTDGATISTPVDSALNSYTALDTNNNGIMHTKAFYAKNIAAGVGNLAVTAAVTGGTVYGSVIAHELSGRDLTAPLGASVANYQTGVGTGTDAITSTAVTSGDGYDVVGATTESGFDGPAIATGTGFTTGQSSSDQTQVNSRSETLTQSGAGTKAATFTTSNTGFDWITHVATFVAAAAGGRTTKNTRSAPLGTEVGMGFRM